MNKDSEQNSKQINALTAKTNCRLDVFLASSTDFSRAYCQQLIKKSLVKTHPEGITITDCSYRVSAGDQFTFTPLPSQKFHIEPENIPLDVMYDDEDVIVINKPAGMVTHPAIGHTQSTLVHALLHHCKNSLSGINGTLKPGIVHRLDRYTSGLIIIAKNDKAHLHLAHQMEQRYIKRKYVAFCHGDVTPRALQVDENIGRHHSNRLKMAVTQKGRHASTSFSTMGVYRIHGIGKVSLVQCSLHTGRTHQIRVHASHQRFPVVNDTLYGGKDITSFVPSLTEGRQALHAFRVSFEHPVTEKELSFQAPLPNDLNNLLDLCTSSEVLFTNPEQSVQKTF